MTRRFISLFSFVCLLAMAAHADRQAIEINLNQQNEYCDTNALKEADLYVTAIPDNSNDQAQIKLEIKNQSEGFGLLLFDRGYTEKDTKSKDWKNQYFEINWDDELKNNGPVEATTGLNQPVFFIDLSETRVLPVQMIIGNGGTEFNLAIYLCKIEKRNKKNQSQPQKVKMKFSDIHPIKINLELGPDTEFEQLKEECDAFIRTINNWSFCPCEGGCKMKKHHPNIDGQIENLKTKMNEKVDDIRKIARSHGILVDVELKKTKYQPLIDDIQQAFKAKVEDIKPEKLEKCPDCRKRDCNTCHKQLGNGKNGTCTGYHCKKCGVSIGKGKTYCKKHEPVPPYDITWKQAGQKWEAIYQKLKNNKNYTCQQAKNEAGAIYNQVKDKPDDGKKKQAMRSYQNIQLYCK